MYSVLSQLQFLPQDSCTSTFLYITIALMNHSACMHGTLQSKLCVQRPEMHTVTIICMGRHSELQGYLVRN